ncbi:ribosomal-processing cysteine protease Prp [Alkalihalobacillus sp. 1P02AB]|uniref:ribosomal-processing cysteine protease Prp n=1 Tax=Alkalihalobacillus sp. 1P02AB TaxID=3132260 RepID=UPI0039A759A1
MITVKVTRNDNQKIDSFLMSGHAESGPYGYDLVCAGASAVSLGAVNAIYSILNVELDVEMKEDGGYLFCSVPASLDADTFEKVQLLLEGMVASLQSIAQEYHEHMTIIASK